jgi:hypothetical protein
MQSLVGDLVLLVLATWVMSREMRRRPVGGFFRPVLLGFAPVFLVSVFFFTALQRNEPEISKFKEGFVAQMTDATMALNNSKDGVKAEDVRQAVSLLLRLYAGLQCLFWLCALSVIALPLRLWLTRKGLSKNPAPLSQWKAPDLAIWLVLLPAAVLLFGQAGWAGEPSPWIRELSLNVLVVSLAIYVFQGVMVVTEKLGRLGVPKPATVVVMGLALGLSLLLQGRGLGAGILALGLLETWFDFRNLNKKDTDKQRSA